MDLIRAKTDRSMKAALNQLDGELSQLIRNLRQEILDVLVKSKSTLTILSMMMLKR